MTNDNDLIRRGDAKTAAATRYFSGPECWQAVQDAIDTVPAVRVKPLEFDEWDGGMRVAKTPFGKYRIGGLDGGFDASGPNGWRCACGSEEAALKACQDHYEKGTRAALDTPAPEPVIDNDSPLRRHAKAEYPQPAPDVADDLVKRLRVPDPCCEEHHTQNEAADRIEEADRAIANLQREYDKRGDRIEALEKALRDIAGVAKLGMGHNLAPVVRLAQRIEAMAVSAHLREEK